MIGQGYVAGGDVSVLMLFQRFISEILPNHIFAAIRFRLTTYRLGNWELYVI